MSFQRKKVASALAYVLGAAGAAGVAAPALAQDIRVEVTGSSIKRIDAETSDYYVLGYSSTNPDPLKRTRKIEVKLTNRPNVSVWSRTSYSLRQLPKPEH